MTIHIHNTYPYIKHKMVYEIYEMTTLSARSLRAPQRKVASHSARWLPSLRMRSCGMAAQTEMTYLWSWLRQYCDIVSIHSWQRILLFILLHNAYEYRKGTESGKEEEKDNVVRFSLNKSIFRDKYHASGKFSVFAPNARFRRKAKMGAVPPPSGRGLQWFNLHVLLFAHNSSKRNMIVTVY